MTANPDWDYMISNAFTKDVQKKGRISVNQGQCVIIAVASATEDARNNSQ